MFTPPLPLSAKRVTLGSGSSSVAPSRVRAGVSLFLLPLITPLFLPSQHLVSVDLSSGYTLTSVGREAKRRRELSHPAPSLSFLLSLLSIPIYF